MQFKFVEYSSNELNQCGEAFVVAHSASRALETRDKTQRVKEFFANTAATTAHVHPNHQYGEMLFDQCHIQYPARQERDTDLDFWKRILTCDYRVRLALESEWGRCGSTTTSIVRVLNDAQKLAFTRADVKVIVFASCKRDDCAHFVECISKLRKQTRDDSPWLWVDFPWTSTTRITHGVLSNR